MLNPGKIVENAWTICSYKSWRGNIFHLEVFSNCEVDTDVYMNLPLCTKKGLEKKQYTQSIGGLPKGSEKGNHFCFWLYLKIHQLLAKVEVVCCTHVTGEFIGRRRRRRREFGRCYWQSHIFMFLPFRGYIPIVNASVWLFPLFCVQCTTAVAMVRPPLDVRVYHWQATIKDTMKHHFSCSTGHCILSKVSKKFDCSSIPLSA